MPARSAKGERVGKINKKYYSRVSNKQGEANSSP